MAKRWEILEMFEKISPVYDLANHLLSLGMDFYWRKKLAEKIKPYQPEAILDLACGTMDLGIASKKILPEAEFYFSDFSLKMLKLGIRKLEKIGFFKESSLILADAQELPFKKESFSAVIIGFGVRNFPEPQEALKEMYRVLCPGGILGILEFSLPKNFLFRIIYQFYLGWLLPAIGYLLSGERAYYYLRDSIKNFPPPKDFEKELEQAGFELKASIGLTQGVCWLYLAEKPKK